MMEEKEFCDQNGNPHKWSEMEFKFREKVEGVENLNFPSLDIEDSGFKMTDEEVITYIKDNSGVDVINGVWCFNPTGWTSYSTPEINNARQCKNDYAISFMEAHPELLKYKVEDYIHQEPKMSEDEIIQFFNEHIDFKSKDV